MSEWNRGGREDEQRRYGFNQRREGREETGWADNARGDEQRSFGQQGGQGWTGGQRDRSQGWGAEGYRGPGETYGGGWDDRQDYSRQGFDRPSFGGQGYGGQGFGGQSYTGQSYSGQRYAGQGSAGQDYTRQQFGGRSYGRDYGGQAYGGQSYSRVGQTGFNAQNEPLQRVTDGETGGGFRGALGVGQHEGEHRGRGPKNYTRSDERIRDDVNDRLSDDSWLDASEIDVQVSKCEVTLTGTVNSREDKRRAEDLADQVSGVKHVQNNLRVQQQAGGQQFGWRQTGGQQSETQTTSSQATGQTSGAQTGRA